MNIPASTPTPTQPSQSDCERATILAYDNLAPHYNEAPKFHPNHMERSVRRLMDNDLHLLEIGCGPGQCIPLFYSLGIHNIVAIDASQNMIKRAKIEYSGVDFRTMNVLELTQHFSPNQFSAFWAYTILMHIDRSHMSNALQQIRSVMQKGAIGAISVPLGSKSFKINLEEDSDRGHGVEGILTVNQWDAESLTPHVTQNGFESIDGLTHVCYPMLFMGVRAI